MNYRSHAFVTLLTHALTEGLRTGRFDPLAPNGTPTEPLSSIIFDAPLGSVPIRAWIRDWRLDEARVAIAAWPTPNVDRWIAAGGANGLAGEVFASGWLERGSRVRLVNVLDPSIFIRKNRVTAMRALPKPSEDADPLRLYEPKLIYSAAA